MGRFLRFLPAAERGGLAGESAARSGWGASRGRSLRRLSGLVLQGTNFSTLMPPAAAPAAPACWLLLARPCPPPSSRCAALCLRPFPCPAPGRHWGLIGRTAAPDTRFWTRSTAIKPLSYRTSARSYRRCLVMTAATAKIRGKNGPQRTPRPCRLRGYVSEIATM